MLKDKTGKKISLEKGKKISLSESPKLGITPQTRNLQNPRPEFN